MNILKDLFLFINRKELLHTVILTIIATHVTELSASFTDDIIIPLLSTDINNNNKDDIIELKEYKYKLFNKTFKIGSFFSHIIRFIISILIVFLLNKNM